MTTDLKNHIREKKRQASRHPSNPGGPYKLYVKDRGNYVFPWLNESSKEEKSKGWLNAINPFARTFDKMNRALGAEDEKRKREQEKRWGDEKRK